MERRRDGSFNQRQTGFWSSWLILAGILFPGLVFGMLDLDQNGVSDVWEQLYLGVSADSTDADGDGFSNLEEAIAGTDPVNPREYLTLTAVEIGENEVIFQWLAKVGKLYRVEVFDQNTEEWEELMSIFPVFVDMPQSIGVEMHESGLFRLVVRDVDADADGLTAWEEGLLGWSDASDESSGVLGRADFIAALRAIESQDGVSLVTGEIIPQRMPSREVASRFLIKASFGPSEETITEVCENGLTGWFDEQLTLTPTKTYTEMWRNSAAINASLFRHGWWRCVNIAEDQLRHRMAYALSQIFVVNMEGGSVVGDNPLTQANYYDHFVLGAFGNYRDVLEQVTYSPVMGFYLSHLNNRKGDPSINRFPDENFAREIMQLFTIGLWELNPDGSHKLDMEGELIPTYGNDTITEMARVFTGMSNTRTDGVIATSFFDGMRGNDYRYPMKVWDDQHDETGPKNIINGVVLPGGPGKGEEEVQAALDALTSHDNIAPFVSRLLIQRFTSSNPSSEYLGRVSRAWMGSSPEEVDSQENQLARVLEAILFDPETLSPDPRKDTNGKVREPMLRFSSLYRAFDYKAENGSYLLDISNLNNDFSQFPTLAPSVFNFYLPDHSPSGEMADRKLFAPELQIATSSQLLLSDNRFSSTIIAGHLNNFPDFSKELALANEADLLVEHLSELLTGGRLGAKARSAIIDAIEAQGSELQKVQAAVHLVSQSMECMTIK